MGIGIRMKNFNNDGSLKKNDFYGGFTKNQYIRELPKKGGLGKKERDVFFWVGVGGGGGGRWLIPQCTL